MKYAAILLGISLIVWQSWTGLVVNGVTLLGFILVTAGAVAWSRAELTKQDRD